MAVLNKHLVRPWWRPAGWHWFILIVALSGAGWLFVGPEYYMWALGDKSVDIHVFCDTSDIAGPGMRAFVLYDKVALSPPAKALGLLQNRAPADVRSFFFMPADDVEITPISIRLRTVHYGPISRVLFVVDGKKFHMDVADRRLLNNTIYVRAPDF